MNPQTPPAPIDAADLALINAKLTELEGLLASHLRSLTEQERRALPKMGDDSIAFVEDGVTAATAKPDVMPARFDLSEMRDAFEFTRQAAPLVPRLEALARGLDDAEMIAGSFAYDDALEVYAQFSSARHSDSTLVPYYDAMAQRFAKQRGPRKPKPPTT